jgi:hypothetical protein
MKSTSISASFKQLGRSPVRYNDALREKIVYSSLTALDDSEYQAAEQSFNPASSPLPSPPKDDDNVIFIIAFRCERESRGTYHYVTIVVLRIQAFNCERY